MYYEARRHEILPACTDIQSVVDLIETMQDYQVATIQHGDRLIGFVCDGHINSPKDEIAVIDITNNIKIESLTWAWIDVSHRFAAIRTACESDLQLGKGDIPAYSQNYGKPVRFECGCCGESFISTIAEQVKYDQDAGYGICIVCAQLHYSHK